jgi:hypothetical protein
MFKTKTDLTRIALSFISEPVEEYGILLEKSIEQPLIIETGF